MKKKKIIWIGAAVLVAVAVIITVAVLVGKSDEETQNFQMKADYSYQIKEQKNGSVKLTLGKKGCRKGIWNCSGDDSVVTVDAEQGRKDVFVITRKTDGICHLTFLLNDGETDIYRMVFAVSVDENRRVNLNGISASAVYEDFTVYGENGQSAKCSSKDTGYLLVKLQCAQDDRWEVAESQAACVEWGEHSEGDRSAYIYGLQEGEHTVELHNVTQNYTLQLQIYTDNKNIVQIVGGAYVNPDSAEK